MAVYKGYDFISVIFQWSVLLIKENLSTQTKTFNLQHAIDKLIHIMLYDVHLVMGGNWDKDFYGDNCWLAYSWCRSNYHTWLILFFILAQSFLNYVLLCLVFTVSLACRGGDRSLVYILKTSGWKYFIISVIDVEANYLVVKAYSYTTIISIQVRKTSFKNRNV